jgi:hypothetical protein
MISLLTLAAPRARVGESKRNDFGLIQSAGSPRTRGQAWNIAQGNQTVMDLVSRIVAPPPYHLGPGPECPPDAKRGPLETFFCQGMACRTSSHF